MSRHDDLVRLRHMRDHAREALEMSRGRVQEDVVSDRMLQLALTRLLEIVGEAAARVSDTCRQKAPEVPWAKITGMRNRLIHGYDNVDLKVLWDTVTENLGPLLVSLDEAIARMEAD